MTRWTKKFEVDESRDPDVLDKIEDLIEMNTYAPATREGIRIMHNILVNNSLEHLLSDEFQNKWRQKASVVKDLRDVVNLMVALEKGDIDYIFDRYKHLEQPMVKHAVEYIGLGNLFIQPQFNQPNPSSTDSFVTEPEELWDEDEVIANLLS